MAHLPLGSARTGRVSSSPVTVCPISCSPSPSTRWAPARILRFLMFLYGHSEMGLEVHDRFIVLQGML